MKTFSSKNHFHQLFTCFLLLLAVNPKHFSQPSLSQSTVQIQKCWESRLANNGSDNTKTIQTLKFNQIQIQESPSSLFSFSEDTIKSLDYKTGKEIWHIDAGGEITAKPLIQRNGIVIVTKPWFGNKGSASAVKLAHHLRFINKETGITEWSKTVYIEDDLYLYGLENVIFLIDQKGNVTAFDQQNGNVLWEKSFSENSFFPPFFFGNNVVFPKDTDFVIVSLIDRKAFVQEKNLYSKLKSLSANEEILFLGDERGLVKALEISSGKKKWSYRLGGSVSSLTYQKGFIVAASLDNFVYYFSADDGNLLWKKRAAGRIIAEPLLFDHTALILAEGSANALLLDLSDGKVVNQLSFPNGTFLTGSPRKLGEMIVFPTEKAIIAYSLGQCP